MMELDEYNDDTTYSKCPTCKRIHRVRIIEFRTDGVVTLRRRYWPECGHFREVKE